MASTSWLPSYSSAAVCRCHSRFSQPTRITTRKFCHRASWIRLGKAVHSEGRRRNVHLSYPSLKTRVNTGHRFIPVAVFSKQSNSEALENCPAICEGTVTRLENGCLIDTVVPDDEQPVKGGAKRSWGGCRCDLCGTRRVIMASLGGLLVWANILNGATASSVQNSDYYEMIRESAHPTRPVWYQELFAQCMARTMGSYEAEVAGYKRQLFGQLDEKVEQILDLGIGTGPNLQYYANMPHLQRVVGVDPNLQMAKYCIGAASAAGLFNSKFEFLHAVGEKIPVPDESMDAVVCTLVLCSVADVPGTLEEVKRVLKPGAAFLFVEHVAAPENTSLRFWQGLLDPLQQWVADGCHLTRKTLQYIEDAEFGSVDSDMVMVKNFSLISPHILGVAYKKSNA